MKLTFINCGYAPNKLLKRDSARVAFLVCVDFGVEVPCGGLVIACFTP
ncbi:DUF3265 domain-containing protein [Vibrio parahaemolyticus]|nr:DUF3265 domain-containing protein [Vibrio parahaemolyticus]EHK4786550.1 DUF3265 domain-containing protein [Vibrio parahaemolyticus]EIA1625581.1 DUF3265 domain-containing protein [Vibrio parahaemolyticus]EIJ0976096.1 DUF3265 domain-containing protein [Vibrio parahaemolyticus]EIK4811262.1 DUF3265 domain-containing protein [Vibrio parahaemolyticus]EIV8637036.1 DUF3265 domain-containing protein [Vibrio parahaemolyticus]